MREPGDPDVAAEVVALYVREARLSLDRIRAAWDTGDWVTLERAAHKLKGGCAAVGAREVERVCAGIASRARANSGDGISASIAELGAALEATLAELFVWVKGGT